MQKKKHSKPTTPKNLLGDYQKLPNEKEEAQNQTSNEQELSKINNICSFINYVVLLFGVATTTLLQPFILVDSSYYNIRAHTGVLISLTLILQLITKICLTGLYQHISNKFGTKSAVFVGAISFLGGSILMAVSKTFLLFVLANFLLSNGTSAITSAPLFANYVDQVSKAKASVISATFVGLSAAVANLFLKALFYYNVSLGACYEITGIFVSLVLTINSFGLVNKKFSQGHIGKDQNAFITDQPKSFSETLEDFKANGWLLITLVLQVLASSDFFLFFTFMTLFLKSITPANNELQTNIFVNNIQTLVFVPSLFFNLVYGFGAEKKVTAIMMSVFALAGGACSFILISSSKATYDWPTISAALLMGATIPGLFIISGYLGIRHFPSNNRKMSIGVMGFFGILSYLIITLLGGLLYDYWVKEGIFFVCAGLLAIGLVIVMMIYSLMIKNDKHIL